MTTTTKAFYWLPRVLSIGFVLFLAMFALDVFTEYSGWDVVLPLLMHLIPSIVLLVAVAVAWRYELVGVVIFLGFAGLYVWMAGLDKPLSWYLVIALPSATVGVLYLVSWLLKRRQR
jgi:hypothetical protein